jgi:hypothetical protein
VTNDSLLEILMTAIRHFSTATAIVVAGLVLAGCHSMPATTIDGAEAFDRHALRVQLDSQLPAEHVARCFEDSAALLPGSTITPYPRSGVFVYRLRAGRYVFESIELTPVAGGGSRAVVTVTPDYNGRMQADFVSNRLGPLYQCAGETIEPTWPLPSAAG